MRRYSKDKDNSKQGKSSSYVSRDETIGSGRYRDKITLNTGVKTGLVINPGQTFDESVSWTSLLCTNGSFLDNPESFYLHELQNSIFWKYYNQISNTVNPYITTTGATGIFTQDKFVNWIKACVRGLQLYYNIEHIIAFNAANPNQNNGMFYLNSQIDATVRRKHRDLRSKLNDMAIPPELVNFINYMYQNYSMSVDPQSPIIRINYNGVFNKAAPTVEAYPTDPETKYRIKLSGKLYENILDDLNSSEVGEINNLISEGFPSDFQNNLPPVSQYPVFDRGFNTFWHNNQMVASIGSAGFRALTSITDDNNKYYGIMDNQLDGLIYACWIVRDITAQDWKPGIFNPLYQFVPSGSGVLSQDRTNYQYFYDGPNNPKGMYGFLHNNDMAVFANVYWTLEHDDTSASCNVVRNGDCSVQRAQISSINNTDYCIDQTIKYLFGL